MVDVALRPVTSRATNEWRPGASGQLGARPAPDGLKGRPSTSQRTSWADPPTARSGSAWNSRRRVGSIRNVDPSAGLETRKVVSRFAAVTLRTGCDWPPGVARV